MRCETKKPNRSQSELDKVTTDKNRTQIRHSEATVRNQISQQSLPDWQMQKGKTKQI